MTAATASSVDSDPFYPSSRNNSSSDSSASSASSHSSTHNSHGHAGGESMGDEGIRELRSSRSSSKFIREQLEGLGGAEGTRGGAGAGSARGGSRAGKGAGQYEQADKVKVESDKSNRRHSAGSNGDSGFEEDEDAGALQWGALQRLDQSDDKSASGARRAEDANDVAAAASALLSASATLPIERDGIAAAAAAVAAAAERMDDSPTNTAASSQHQAAMSVGAPIVGATFQPAAYIPLIPRPQPPGTQSGYPYPPGIDHSSQSSSSLSSSNASSAAASTDGKRKHSSLTHSPSSSSSAHSTPTVPGKAPPSAPLPPSAAPSGTPNINFSPAPGSSSGSSAVSSRKRRKKEDEESSLNLAYERQISLLNEAIRQLLAYVSPLHSQADAYVDELITGYRSEYMKEQLREGRTAENKRYARAMSGYFLSFYATSNLNSQLALQNVAYYPPNGAPGGPATAPISTPSPTAAQSAASGSSSPVASLRPDVLLQQRMQGDTWEGLSHPLYSNLTLLLYTVIDALLMDALQVTLWSLYLERLEPFFILDPSPQSQARMLLLTAYAVKLAYCANHDIYLPYLTGLYAQFSKLFSEYVHSKPGIKLGVSNTQLTARYRLLGSLREKE